MNDAVDRTPDAIALDRFVAELGDALEAHARTLPARPAARGRAPRARRRIALAAAAAAAAAVAIAVGLGGERAGTPDVASAAAVLRASADALAGAAAGPLAQGGVWHTRVDAELRRSDPGRPPFEYTTTTRWETWRGRDGAGRERLTPRGAVAFPSPADRSAWVAAGSPDLATTPSDRRLPADPRPFRFGAEAVSYRRLERLPTDPDALAPVLARAVERRRDALPATFDAAEARAYARFELIRDSFEAPTSPALRAALYDLAATTPGIRLAGATTDAAGRAGTAVDVVLGDARFVLVVDPRSGALLETRRILLRASAQFPDLAPGLLSRATYVDAGAVPRDPAGR